MVFRTYTVIRLFRRKVTVETEVWEELPIKRISGKELPVKQQYKIDIQLFR
jgi:hypothetical protein